MSEHIIIEGISPDGQQINIEVEIEEGSITVDGYCRFFGGFEPIDLDSGEVDMPGKEE